MRERIAVFPFDWSPSKADQVLAFGRDLEAPPLVRPASAFLTFPDAVALSRRLFWAEDRAALERWDRFTRGEAANPRAELARRLFLYRTALQARRVIAAAKARPGKTLLVIVGANHERDIEAAVRAEPELELVQAPDIGEPTETAAAAFDSPRHAFAVLSFNLLGQQAQTQHVDLSWMEELIGSLRRTTPEVRLFQIRLSRLSGQADGRRSLEAYRRLLEGMAEDASFTWTGATDRTRLDSFFDPFGNLTVRQRVQLEIARELNGIGKRTQAARAIDGLGKELPRAMRAQLYSYWEQHVVGPANRTAAQAASD